MQQGNLKCDFRCYSVLLRCIFLSCKDVGDYGCVVLRHRSKTLTWFHCRSTLAPHCLHFTIGLNPGWSMNAILIKIKG